MSERKLIQQLRDTIAEFDKHLYPSSNTGEWLLSFKWERPDIESQLDAADAYLAAPVAPALVPLTPDQRADLWRTTPFRGSGGQFDWFIDGVCAAERHHGIKP